MENMLRAILDRVLKEAQAYGTLAEGTDLHYQILFPELDVEDNVAMANAAQYFIAGLTQV